MLEEISAAAGFFGVAIAIAAYLPQITHLVREHCSAGISRMAFGMWFIASLLVTFHAVVILDGVFIVLGTAQTLASLVIFIFSTKYRDGICQAHALLASAHNNH